MKGERNLWDNPMFSVEYRLETAVGEIERLEHLLDLASKRIANLEFGPEEG